MESLEEEGEDGAVFGARGGVRVAGPLVRGAAAAGGSAVNRWSSGGWAALVSPEHAVKDTGVSIARFRLEGGLPSCRGACGIACLPQPTGEWIWVMRGVWNVGFVWGCAHACGGFVFV